MLICFLGKPLSGKTTLSRELNRCLNFNNWFSYRISAGDIARKLAERDPEVKAALAKGEMAPPEKLLEAIELEITKKAAHEFIILDGFPRYAEQLHAMDSWDKSSSYRIGPRKTMFIHVETPIEDIKSRYEARNRPFDNLDGWLENYDKLTAPMIEWIASACNTGDPNKHAAYISVDGTEYMGRLIDYVYRMTLRSYWDEK